MVATSPDYFRSEVPAGSIGEWVVEKVLIPERDYDASSDPRPECFQFRPGSYTCLRRGPTQFMTDLYDEWWTQRRGIAEALARGGEVLVSGLGLGLVAEAMLRPAGSPVRRVTILEQSPEVIGLVAPHLQRRYGDRVEVLAADAFAWTPPTASRFTVGWHDIWPNPTAAEVPAEIERLRAWYRPWCDWQGFWPESHAQASAGVEAR